MANRAALRILRNFTETEALLLASQCWTKARQSAEELSRKVMGEDFDQRVEALQQRYAGPERDPFGLEAETAKYAVSVCALFHRLYFRTEVHGIENVPRGRAILVANHSGQLPIDAAIIGAALFLDLNPPRFMRAMVDRFTQTLPFVSTFFSRVGQVVGSPEICGQLLDREELIVTFPEGVRGIAKPFSRRYRLEEFGAGFVRAALRHRAPVVPVAVVGAEEQYIGIGNLDWAARALKMPAFPIVPQLLVPGGQLPLPTKYRLHFGEPRWFAGDERDEQLVQSYVEEVKGAIAALLAKGLRERRSVFF